MAAPLRVGFLDDLADGPPSPTDVEQWLRLVADEYLAAGRLDREVEIVASFGLGLPSGTAAAVEHAFARLDAADVLLVVGPAVGNNALVVTPLTERFQLPTINWAGTERARVGPTTRRCSGRPHARTDGDYGPDSNDKTCQTPQMW
jgi:hypothetical protein